MMRERRTGDGGPRRVTPAPPPVRYRVAARGGLNSLDYGAELSAEEAARMPALTLAYLVEIGVLEVAT